MMQALMVSIMHIVQVCIIKIMEVNMYKEIKSQLTGIDDAAELCEAIMDFALKSEEKVVQDVLLSSYFLPMAYLGVLPDNAPKVAVDIAGDIPNGCGLQIEGDNVLPLEYYAAQKVIGLATAEIGKKLTTDLLENDSAEYLRLTKERGYFAGVKATLGEEKVTGNALKSLLKPRGFVKVVGKNGDVSIYTSDKLAINDANQGQLVFSTKNGASCNTDFCIVGKAHGIIGAMSAFSDYQFGYFYYDVTAKQLLLEQHSFNSKKKANYVKVLEHGTLIY